MLGKCMLTEILPKIIASPTNKVNARYASPAKF
jgi:hypothetical protein